MFSICKQRPSCEEAERRKAEEEREREEARRIQQEKERKQEQQRQEEAARGCCLCGVIVEEVIAVNRETRNRRGSAACSARMRKHQCHEDSQAAKLDHGERALTKAPAPTHAHESTR